MESKEIVVLSPDCIINEMERRLAEINEVRRVLERQVENYPEGSIKINRRGASFQFYFRTQESDTKGKYMPVKEREKARQIIQKGYDLDVIKEIRREEQQIKRFLKDYRPEHIQAIYERQGEIRKKFINPVQKDIEAFILDWTNTEYCGKSFEGVETEYFTENGERVRSKSEIVIANALKRANIPYRYEYPTKVSRMGIVYPDFTCLNKKTRKEIIWEHFGKMDDEDYANKTVRKINNYELAGFKMGKNLIATYESSTSSLSTRMIDHMIKEYL